MASYTKPDERMTESDLIATLVAAVPTYAYRAGQREWTWTRPSGVWHLNLVLALDQGGPRVKARLSSDPSIQVCVRTTRREVDAMLHFLVAVNAIDTHPDDPIAADL